MTRQQRWDPGRAVCAYGCSISLMNPVSAWLRKLNLDAVWIGDCDWIIYKYGERFSPERGIDRSVRWHMIVEIKTEDAEPSRDQAEALWVTSHLLRNIRWVDERGDDGQFVTDHAQNARIVEVDMRQFGGHQKTLIYSYGAHLLQFSGRGPADSERIRWNRHEVTADELREILEFRRHPFSRQPIRPGMHKKRREQPPTLFEDNLL